MDSSMLFYLVVALIGVLIPGAILLSNILRGSRGLRKALRGVSPSQPVPDPDDLGPYELALIAGGPVRVGETAIMDAFLDGRIRQQSAGDLFALAGSAYPDLHEGVVRRDLIDTFKHRVSIGAREIMRGIVTGYGVKLVRDNLARSGLVVDSPELHEALTRRQGAARTIRRMRFSSLGALVIGAALLLTGEPSFLTAAVFVIAASSLVSLIVCQIVMTLTGGPLLSPNTPAGDTVLELARKRYAAPMIRATGFVNPTNTSFERMSRYHAVRHTAVTGFLALRERRREAPPPRHAVGVTSGPPAHVRHADAAEDTNGTDDVELARVTLETLCDLAGVCLGSGSDTSGGGASGGDGWDGDGGFGGGDGGGGGGGDGGGGGG